MSFIHRRLAFSPPARGARLCVFIHLHSICKITRERHQICRVWMKRGQHLFLCLYLWMQMRAAHLCRERIWLRTQYFRGGRSHFWVSKVTAISHPSYVRERNISGMLSRIFFSTDEIEIFSSVHLFFPACHSNVTFL